MSSSILVFGSSRDRGVSRRRGEARVTAAASGTALTMLREGARGIVLEVRSSDDGRVDRLLALGVTPGARVTVLQTFPGIVFLCDQTELAIERGVADSIIVRSEEIRS
jgi:DtxR family transcriptional regulator, Mn-dependent transcriptional regulator